MKKLIGLIVLMFTLFISGCEPPYSQPSEIHLTGGTWIFTDYQIVVIRAISNVTVIQNDTICINAFGEQTFVSGGILMKQHYTSTAIDRRFIKGVTKWEFDMSSSYLYCNNDFKNYFTVDYPGYMKKEKDEMCINNPSNGAVTNYSFTTDALGANYPRKLTLVSPPIVSDLLLSNGMRDKAVTVQVILTFMR